MNGLIVYASKYGSTREYAHWTAEATGLVARDFRDGHIEIKNLDFLVIGLPVIYHRLFGGKWVLRNLDALLQRPLILFTVSGAPAGEKLDTWIANSLPRSLIDHMHHVALRGRQNPKDITFFDRMMLIIAGLMNPDRQASREELHGFDFMDIDSIQPIVDQINELKRDKNTSDGIPAAPVIHRI